MEINKTSAQKLDNNVQVAQSTTTKPAVKTAEETSFKDAVSMMSDIDVANNSKVDTKPANTAETTNTANSTKDFQFISTTENKPSFDKTLNKENLSTNEKLNIHQKAEKELVKEITLVNNKQIELKSNKNENQIAQVSTAIKSDKEIESEKSDKTTKLNKQHSKDSDLLDLSSNNQNQQSDLNDNSEIANTIVQKNINNDLINSIEPKNNNSDILDLNVNETVSKKDMNIPDVNVNETISKKDVNVPDVNINETVSKKDVNIPDVKLTENTSKKETTIDIEKNNFVKTAETLTNEKTVNNKNLKETQTPEVIGSVANADTKVSNNLEEALVTNVTKNSKLDDNFKNNMTFDYLNKQNDKLSQKVDTKAETKTPTNKGISGKKSNSKVDNDVKIIKDIAQEVGDITPDDAVKLNKPDANSKDMKVITFAPISPVQDLKENLTTTKTSDIVKFIDANLETNSAKKASKSNSTSATKKAEEKAIKMTEADAKFFQNLVENNSQVAQDAKATDMAQQSLKDVEEAHSAKVSKSLLNALKESQETNKSFRVDFDKDLSVILKVNREGKISAEFLPGDAAVEQYLKSNIPLLKQKFNDEGLEYENLSYRDQSRKDKEEKRNNKNNKENGYE